MGSARRLHERPHDETSHRNAVAASNVYSTCKAVDRGMRSFAEQRTRRRAGIRRSVAGPTYWQTVVAQTMWQIAAGTGATILLIVILASLMSIRRVLVLEPAVVFRG